MNNLRAVNTLIRFQSIRLKGELNESDWEFVYNLEDTLARDIIRDFGIQIAADVARTILSKERKKPNS